MALSASLATGLNTEAKVAADSITGSIREQVSMLERAAALEARMGRGPRRSAAASPTGEAFGPPAPAWSWVSASQLSSNQGLSVTRDKARQEFRSLLNEEIKSARSRREFEGFSPREMARSAGGVVELLQGKVTLQSSKDLIELGGMGAFGKRAAAASMKALSVFGPLKAGKLLVDQIVGFGQSTIEDAGKYAIKTKKMDQELKSAFKDLKPQELQDLRKSILEATEKDPNFPLEGFDDAIANRDARRASLQEHMDDIAASDPALVSAALDSALSNTMLSNGVITGRGKNLHAIAKKQLVKQKDIANQLVDLIRYEGKATAVAQAGVILDGIRKNYDEQRRVFAENPIMAGEFHEEMRRKRQIEKWEYEQKQRDWARG